MSSFVMSQGDLKYTLAGTIGGGLLGGFSFDRNPILSVAGDEATNYMIISGYINSLNSF